MHNSKNQDHFAPSVPPIILLKKHGPTTIKTELLYFQEIYFWNYVQFDIILIIMEGLIFETSHPTQLTVKPHRTSALLHTAYFGLHFTAC